MDYNGAITLFLVFSAVYVFCVFGDQEDENVNGLTNLFWMACAIQAMGGVHATVGRVGYYYMVFLVLLLPEVLDDIGETDGRQKMIMTMVVAVCFILYGLNALKHGGWAMSYPYHFFWE